MKVYKFGGASVKDADGVRNVARVLRYTGHEGVLVVISAMGKTTNALENALRTYLEGKDYIALIDEILQQHLAITSQLMPDDKQIAETVSNRFQNLKSFLNSNISTDYDFIYDQVVSTGELVSTEIVSAFLNAENFETEWIDARNFIKTDSIYREGKVDWDKTCHLLNQLDKNKFYITQGFIGSDDHQFTTTLGREGSDYTGAIIAYCLDAESLTIWKDVPGVLNADPRFFKETRQLSHISYEEAIELAYYGASVIHPKTLQPLQRKQIPLFVKSFEQPDKPGTVIQNRNNPEPAIASYIVKQNQNLLRISTRDFSFIDESVIHAVFRKLADNQLKVNLMQISAISLSLCVEDKFHKMERALESFRKGFNIEITPNCTLYTIRHGDEHSEKQIPQNSRTLIRQSGINTLQLLICDA